MEEPVERKDAAVGIAAKEPLKTEGLVPSPDTSETRSEGASSPPPNCSICLGKLRNTSFTDSCLHQFCFTCLLQWSKIKTECPLCKQTFKSIIHNVRSEEDYDQYHVPRELASQLPAQQIASLDVNFELLGGVEGHFRRFVYRTTMTPNRRYGVLLNPEQVARREQIPNMLPSAVSREERRFRRVNPTGYRRNVYQQGEWSNVLAHGRSRECSADYYRRNPHELNRLIPWINRELQILLNANESHIAYVLNVITDALSRYDLRGPEFRDTVRPYFGPYTEHFAHELLNYARTNLDIVGYDQNVTYPTRGRGLSSEYVGRVVSPISSVSSTSSDDSDVRVVDQTIDVSRNSIEVPSVGPHVIDMPGPSTVGETFQVPRMTSGPDILTISSSTSSSSDECEVVGYVKPRHERTPEIIELLSSDGGGEPTNSHDASSRTPCEPRENDSDRAAGPSHEEHHRRVGQRSVRQRRSSNVDRPVFGSGSNTNDDSETTERVRRRRRKSSRAEVRPRARKSARKPRATEEESDRPSPARRRSVARCPEVPKPPTGFDLILGFSSSRNCNWRRGQKVSYKIPASDTASERCASNASRSRSSSVSSRSSSARSAVPKVRKSKARKDRAAPGGSGKHMSYFSGSSSSSSSRSSSTSSTSSTTSKTTSDSDTAWSGESTNRRRGRAKSRRKIASSQSSASDLAGWIAGTPEASGERSSARAKGRNAAHHRQPVNATILRKDSSNPNEWYVKKKSSRATSRSRSSSPSRQRKATDQERKTNDQEKNSRVGSRSRSSSPLRQRKSADQERKTNDQEKKSRVGSRSRSSSSSPSSSSLSSSSPSRQRKTADQDKRSSRARNRSRSSSSSRRSETEPRRATRRAPLGECRERRASTTENPGCSRNAERKAGSSRTKREPALDSKGCESRSDASAESNGRVSGISGRTRAQERSRRKVGAKRRRIRSASSDSGRSRPLVAAAAAAVNPRRRDQESRSDQAKRKDPAKRSNHGRKRDHSSRSSDQAKKAEQSKRHDRNVDQTTRDEHRKKGETSKCHNQERKNVDQERKTTDQERSKSDRTAPVLNATPSHEIASLGNGTRTKDHARRNDDACQPSTSRHSESERKSTSKDKHKSKKKQKAKRRRSRSESKSGARNSRHRMARSSSYSPPTTKRDEQQ